MSLRGAQLDGPRKPRSSSPLDWGVHALCEGTPVDRWVPDVHPGGRGAVIDWHCAHCWPCPVYDRCLEWAAEADEHGVWAATTQAERRVWRRGSLGSAAKAGGVS